jgi:hypothetical protein
MPLRNFCAGPGASGAEAFLQKECLIAALKALRHPKASLSANFTEPKEKHPGPQERSISAI